ncbi:hypothetical protein CDZ98_06810 [Mameliella alba]|nr:hypothetical protein CDZ98_06810 [Mameliella alba]
MTCSFVRIPSEFQFEDLDDQANWSSGSESVVLVDMLFSALGCQCCLIAPGRFFPLSKDAR